MFFDDAFNNIPKIILIIDPVNGSIIDANNKACEIYGYSRQQLINMNINDINILSQEKIFQEINNAKLQQNSFYYFPHKTSSGKIIEMEINSTLTTYEGKEVFYVTLKPTNNDNYLRNIFYPFLETSKDSLIIVDNQMKIINFNSAFQLSFNINEEKCIHQPLHKLLNTKEINKINKFYLSLKDGQLPSINILTLDGKYLNLFGIPSFFSDEYRGSLILIEDITKKVVKRNKQKMNYELALQKVEAYKKQTEQFFSRMSHNMRTPLTAILAFSEFGIKENKVEKDKEYFQQINESAHYLLCLVDDILNMNKLESGVIKLNPKPISKKKVLNNILNIMRVFSNQNDIKIETKFDNKMWDYQKFDLIRLEQVYINILHNAIKYSPKGSTVTWEKYYLYDENGNPYFKNIIRDRGIGISKEFLNIIFSPYSQEDNNIFNNEEGNGLGLTITKSILDLLGGKIWIESEVGVGTTVYFEIPACEISEKEYLKYIEENNVINIIENKKVLICEDNLINIKIINKILTSLGIQTDIALNGEIGVKKAKSNNYFAILMDLQMPIMDGFTSAKIIRQFNKDIPIIAISANSTPSDISKSKKVSMNYHLKKPINQKELIETLSNFL